MKIYDIVYSMGRDCACASYMQRALIRSTSGPLDWLAGGNFVARSGVILNQFDNFLNEADLVPYQKKEGYPDDKDCDYYENKKTGFCFFHDFPTGVPLKESFSSVKEKYDRRIARFYENVRRNDKVLLAYLSHFPESESSVDEIIEATRKLCDFFGKSVDFLIVLHDPMLPPGKIEYKLIDNRVHFYRLFTWDNTPLQFRGLERYVTPLFTQFGLKDTRYRRIMRGIGRVCSAVLPLRSWRKRVRKFFE